MKKIVEPGRASKPLAIVPPSTEGRGRSSRSRVKEEVVGAGEVGGVLRRGTSVENVNPCREHFTGSGESVDKQNNGNLKRFKTGYEQVCRENQFCIVCCTVTNWPSDRSEGQNIEY